MKTDSETGEAIGNGIGFVEFNNEDLAMFAVRYLNNYEIISAKGLIADLDCVVAH